MSESCQAVSKDMVYSMHIMKARERTLSYQAREMLATVAPVQHVRRDIFGRTKLVVNPDRDTFWQRMLIRGVNATNNGEPFRQTDVLRASDNKLTTIFTDALETVVHEPGMPDKPGLGWALFGLAPTLPGVYDLFGPLRSATMNRLHGRDHGRVLPTAAMTALDLSGIDAVRRWVGIFQIFRGFTPGSARSLERPIWSFQKAEQIILADEAFATLGSQDKTKPGWQKYLRVAEKIKTTQPELVAQVTETVVRLAKIATGAPVDKSAPLPVLTAEQQAKLHPIDIIRYNLGYRLLGAISYMEHEVAKRPAVPQSYGSVSKRRK